MGGEGSEPGSSTSTSNPNAGRAQASKPTPATRAQEDKPSTVRNIVGGVGNSIWGVGPGFIGMVAGWVPGGDPVKDYIEDGRQNLEDWWGADTTSSAYRWSEGTTTVVTIVAGASGAIRGGMRLAARLGNGLRGSRATAATVETATKACANSFTGDTLVLMADGTKKPIKDVKLGDEVMAADPETGEQGPRKVVDLIRHAGLHIMVAIRLADGTTINATDQHPFWVVNRGMWVDGIDLGPGDQTLASDGRSVSVERVGVRTEDLIAYNLTVDRLHTYFAGEEPVLVHNASCPTGLRGATDGLNSVFSGGSVRGRSIADIRGGLLDNGFTQGLAKNKSGYLFRNGSGEEVRIMSRGGSWDIRVRNSKGNYLDEFGNVATPGSTHNIEVFSR